MEDRSRRERAQRAQRKSWFPCALCDLLRQFKRAWPERQRQMAEARTETIMPKSLGDGGHLDNPADDAVTPSMMVVGMRIGGREVEAFQRNRFRLWIAFPDQISAV